MTAVLCSCLALRFLSSAFLSFRSVAGKDYRILSQVNVKAIKVITDVGEYLNAFWLCHCVL